MSAEMQEQETLQQPTAITEVNTAVAEFDRVAAGISALKQQYQGVVFEVTTTAGMKSACDARAAIRAPRYEVEKVRKAVKAPLLKLGKDIDARAAQISDELLALESPVDEQIKNEERRKEEERKRKADAERARVAAIQEAIENDLRCVPAAMVGRSAADLEVTIRDVVAIEVTTERFAEFTPIASSAKELTLGKLREMHSKQLAHEAEQSRIAAERAELERQKLANEEAARQERERIAAEQAAEAEKKRQQRELNQLRLRRIAYINNLVLVATTGRADRKAGTRECLTETLAEVRALLITETEYGDMLDSAIAARDAAAQQIGHNLQRFDERQRQREQQEQMDREAELNQARMGEIQAIGHQVIIASTGRLGVRAGGTRECIVETLAETKAWPVGEDKFGSLAGAAHAARIRACQQIQSLLDALDERVRQEAEQKRIDEERAAAQAEHARIAAENARQAEELRRQQEALAEQQAELDRQRDAMKPVAQVPAATEPEAEPVLTTAPVQAHEFAPNADDIAQLVTTEYGVSLERAMCWCLNAFDEPVAQRAIESVEFTGEDEVTA